MFKRGDFVKVKPGTVLETGDIVNDWAGDILMVFKKEQTCLVNLDAVTIRSLTDDYLIKSLELEAEPIEYVFDFADLELAKRRDTDEEIMEALEELADRMIVLEGGTPRRSEEDYKLLKESLIRDFQDSHFYPKMSASQQEFTPFIIGSFMELADEVLWIQPEDWDKESVKEVCLELVPEHIINDEVFFENYGEVLQSFMRFLDENSFLENGKELIGLLERIKNKIPIAARDPQNWGLSKKMFLKAEEAGVDLSDEAAIEKFLANNPLRIDNSYSPTPSIPPPDPFKGIGRNQKIAVRYEDGKIIKEIKFKRVEKDLRSGACEIFRG